MSCFQFRSTKGTIASKVIAMMVINFDDFSRLSDRAFVFGYTNCKTFEFIDDFQKKALYLHIVLDRFA